MPSPSPSPYPYPSPYPGEQLLRLSRECEALRRDVDGHPAAIERAVRTKTKALQERYEELEAQLKLLKDMVRARQVDVKVREVDVQKLKQQVKQAQHGGQGGEEKLSPPRSHRSRAAPPTQTSILPPFR